VSINLRSFECLCGAGVVATEDTSWGSWIYRHDGWDHVKPMASDLPERALVHDLLFWLANQHWQRLMAGGAQA